MWQRQVEIETKCTHERRTKAELRVSRRRAGEGREKSRGGEGERRQGKELDKSRFKVLTFEAYAKIVSKPRDVREG